MQRGRAKSKGRLEFEEELIAGIHRHRKSHSFFPVFLTALTVMLLLGLAVWASQAVQLSSWSGLFQSTGHLDKTCTAVIEALRDNRLRSPLGLCADSESGATMLEQENKKIFKAKDPAASGENETDPKPRTFSVAFLSAVRRELDGLGVAWDEVRPLAFGGVRAKVFDPETMSAPADSVTGELYFAIADKVFALEFTARRCGANFVITDFWKCRLLDIPPERIKQRVAAHIRAFRQEPSLDSRIRIKGPKQVFLPLES